MKPERSTIVHEIGHMVVGLAVGIREQGVSFIKRPREDAQAYYDRSGPPEKLVRRSLGGILAQIEYEPDSLAGDLLEAFKKGVILDRYHPDAATDYLGQIRVPTQARDDLRDAMCFGARALGSGGKKLSAYLAAVEAEVREIIRARPRAIAAIVSDVEKWWEEPERKIAPIYSAVRVRKIFDANSG
jgi:hypothetical protein